MQVKRNYSPVTVTLDTSKELDIFWSVVEDAYGNYEVDSPEREFLIALSNRLSDNHEVDEDPYKDFPPVGMI